MRVMSRGWPQALAAGLLVALVCAALPPTAAGELIFSAGFESGDALAWSAIAPELTLIITEPVDGAATSASVRPVRCRRESSASFEATLLKNAH